MKLILDFSDFYLKWVGFKKRYYWELTIIHLEIDYVCRYVCGIWWDNDISQHFRCPIWYHFCRSDSRSPRQLLVAAAPFNLRQEIPRWNRAKLWRRSIIIHPCIYYTNDSIIIKIFNNIGTWIYKNLFFFFWCSLVSSVPKNVRIELR